MELGHRSMNRRSWKLGLSLILFALIGIILSAKMITFAFFPLRSSETSSVVLEIRKGTLPNDITRQFILNKVIEDSRSFILLGRLTRQWKNIKAGEYRFSAAMSPMDIFNVLTSGISIAHPITVREGENIYEIADDMEKSGLTTKREFLALCKSKRFIATFPLFAESQPPTLEGFLFPDTYHFNRSQTLEEMVRTMVRTFHSHWGPQEDKDAVALGMNLHQVITLASIIEKETGAAQERPVISAVFHNRLKKGMKLQSDPTTIYGIWENYDGNIHKRDLASKNNYNTYTINALPIGPISNPGKESIQAALHPVNSPYLYFVSHNDGTHQFSTNINDHNQAVKKYQLDPRARSGKSARN
ncbi:MAG: endolytic transglycosylase MltG [Bdellovibrio sp.]|nr:endolytic transglycosylase MltG [Bdellovibrio sp.]